MLDPDAYSSEGLGGSFGNGGSRNASGNASKGGSNPNAVDPQRSAPACASYCKGFQAQCAGQLGGRDCLTACADEVNGNGKDCQALGIKALECLAPFFNASVPSQSCEASTSNGMVACSSQLSQFGACRPPGDRPSPMPNPKPNPRPDPRAGLVDGCAESVASAPDMCIRFYSCSDGAYLLECVSQLDGRYSCSCSFPSGVIQGAIYDAGSDPCSRAGTDCGFF
jgi:hypothetical protein